MFDDSFVKKKFLEYIDKIIENGRVSHAYLIEVDDYETDFQFISLFIKMIITNQKSDFVLNSDNTVFSLIDNNKYPDLFIIEADGNNIKKNQLLDLQKEYSNKSLLNNKRFYIIKEAEKLNVASANTMLKFLEEPPEGIYAFLITNNRYSVIETILSRCQILSIKNNSSELHLGDSIFEIINCINNPELFFLRNKYIVNEVITEKNNLKEIFIELENIIIKYCNHYYDNNYILEDEIVAELCKSDIYYLLEVLSIIENELPKIQYNVNYKLWLDSFFSKIIMGGNKYD